MTSEVPNLVVVLGSESAVLRPIVKNLAKEIQVIRVYSRATPDPLLNCCDVPNIMEVPDIVNNFFGSSEVIRLGFIGAAFKRQQSLLVDQPMDEIDEMIDTNISLYIRAMKVLLPIMIRAKYGRIVYLSSFRSEASVRGASIYSASKAFGESFFSAVGKEYGRFGIATTSIRMGYFDSGMIDDYDSETKRRVTRSIAMNRLGTSNDLESVIQFCFSEAYLNSGVIELNGGLNLG